MTPESVKYDEGQETSNYMNSRANTSNKHYLVNKPLMRTIACILEHHTNVIVTISDFIFFFIHPCGAAGGMHLRTLVHMHALLQY